MAASPRTFYAKAEGDVHVAYQVVGHGPIDLIFVPAFVSNVDIWWEFPPAARFLRRIASACRLILVDKRGTGLSDRLNRIEPMEERADDVRAVMDAVGAREAIIFSASEGVPIAVLFAAAFPQRVRGLLLWGSIARWARAPDYPWGASDDKYTQIIELATEKWGTGFSADFLMPSRSTEPKVRNWFARYEKASSSPGAFAVHTLNNTLIDIRSVLPAVHTPARVLHAASDSFVTVDAGRFVASQLANATYAELPGRDHAFFGSAEEQLGNEIVRFVSAPPRRPKLERALATILVVETRSARRGVDDRHLVAAEVDRGGGQMVRWEDRTAVAWFAWPGRALRCARAIRNASSSSPSETRSCVYTGELPLGLEELAGELDPVIGLLDDAASGEIVVNDGARNLVAGSEFHFELRSSREKRVHVLVDLAKGPRDDLRRQLEDAVGRAVKADRQAPRLAPLSRRQSEIAYLVSCGLSNRAIASRLFISERTAENHVYNILTSLRFEARTQLAAWVARQT